MAGPARSKPSDAPAPPTPQHSTPHPAPIFLAKLKAAGLVEVRAQGRMRFYRATKSDMGALAVILESFWTDRLGALKRLAEASARKMDKME